MRLPFTIIRNKYGFMSDTVRMDSQVALRVRSPGIAILRKCHAGHHYHKPDVFQFRHLVIPYFLLNL